MIILFSGRAHYLSRFSVIMSEGVPACLFRPYFFTCPNELNLCMWPWTS